MENQPRILRTNTGYQLGKLHVEGLAPRESQALLLRATGLSIADCAQAMNCGKSSVQDRIVNLFFKLNADSTPELITKAFQRGFLKFLTLAAAIHMGTALSTHSTLTKPTELFNRRTVTTATSTAPGLSWVFTAECDTQVNQQRLPGTTLT